MLNEKSKIKCGDKETQKYRERKTQDSVNVAHVCLCLKHGCDGSIEQGLQRFAAALETRQHHNNTETNTLVFIYTHLKKYFLHS